MNPAGPGSAPGIVVVRAADQQVVPWKNGLGTTREVAVDPPGAGVQGGVALRWRVSLATIERDCPFSAFPGLERTILVARGAGMTLVVDGREHDLGRWSNVVAFPGEAVTTCRLHAGPVLDLNVMVDRARARADVLVLRLVAGEARDAPRAGGTTLLVVLDGEVALEASATEVPLREGDAARLDGAGPLRLRASAAGAVVARTQID